MLIRIGRPIHWGVSAPFAFFLQAGCSDAHGGLCIQGHTARRQVAPGKGIQPNSDLNANDVLHFTLTAVLHPPNIV